jgi:hypothetical protein
MNLVLDRIRQVCETVRQQQQGPISFKKLVCSTKKVFKDFEVDLAIKIVKKAELDTNQFYVEAYYYDERDINDDPPIEVIVYHHFNATERFQTNQITDFLIQIYDAVVHEIRHQHQYQSRDYEHYVSDSEEYRDYLADSDEMDAYALSIAIELLRKLPKHRAKMYMTRLTTLSKMKQNGVFVSVSLNSYVEHFKGTRLLKKISKKVYKYLDTLDSDLIFK